MSGCIVIYRWDIPQEQEDAFRQRWRDVTLQLRSRAGALGSCLTRDGEGRFVAIALWPSEEARSNGFSALVPLDPLPGVGRPQETLLQVEDDLWLGSPFGL